MKYIEGMPKPPRGFEVRAGEIVMLAEDETGFDPNAAFVNLEQYYKDLADTQARYASPEAPQAYVTPETNNASGFR